MIKVIRRLLEDIINNIDAGNSNLSEGECLKAIDLLKEFTDKTKVFSKYEACKYLNISRATFDNYVKMNKLPKGQKQAGFKELSWFKKDLDLFIKNNKK